MYVNKGRRNLNERQLKEIAESCKKGGNEELLEEVETILAERKDEQNLKGGN